MAMFSSLSEKLENAFKKFRSRGKLTEADVKAGMREIKLALLEADVNFKVVKDFVKNVKKGDIIVAEKNFGCGSSREHAPIAIKAAGVSCVIAQTFARIFYRNAINTGLAILECEEASDRIQSGDQVEIDFDTGLIRNLTRNESYQARPFPEFIKNIIRAGGYLNSIR